MAANWVERKFLRDQNLGNKAEDVWQAASTAVDDACKSFNTLYSSIGKAAFILTNGHSILVEVTHEALKRHPIDLKRRVRILFNDHQITAALDEHPAMTFSMEANEERCFLKFSSAEITPDEFSSHVLNDAFFTPRNPGSPKSPRPHTAWS